MLLQTDYPKKLGVHTKSFHQRAGSASEATFANHLYQVDAHISLTHIEITQADGTAAGSASNNRAILPWKLVQSVGSATPIGQITSLNGKAAGTTTEISITGAIHDLNPGDIFGVSNVKNGTGVALPALLITIQYTLRNN